MIDLNDFVPDGAVTVSSDGSSGVLAESNQGYAELFNDPDFGDPNVILPELGGLPTTLRFDYTFLEPGTLNNDLFEVYVFNANGFILTTPDFATTDPGTGTVSLDLAPLSGNLVGAWFNFRSLAGDSAMTSSVTISNVTLSTTAVPEPSALALFSIGGLGLVLSSRPRKR